MAAKSTSLEKAVAQVREQNRRRPHDIVENPAHYTEGRDDVYEPIKVIEAWKLGFCDGNTVKYIARAGRKPGSSRAEDLKKALWYLKREIQHAEAEDKEQF